MRDHQSVVIILPKYFRCWMTFFFFVETRNPLSNIIKDTSTIMHNPLPELRREGLRMIVLVSLIVLLRGFLVSTIFRMLHPYIHIHSSE